MARQGDRQPAEDFEDHLVGERDRGGVFADLFVRAALLAEAHSARPAERRQADVTSLNIAREHGQAITSRVSPDELDHALRELPRIGKLLKVRPYRQVWRFEFGGKPYYLKFYPRNEGKLKRLIRGSSALREFLNLQALQRAGVPSPRAVAHLSGFTLEQLKGDAVILEGIEPSVQLDHHLNDLTLRGERPADHRGLARQIIDMVHKLGEAKL